MGPPASFPVWSETCHFLCLLRPFLPDDCIVFAEVWYKWARHHSVAGMTIRPSVLFGRRLSWSLLRRCTVVHPTRDIIAPAPCTPSGGLQHDGWAETHLGQEVVFCAGLGRDVRIELWQIICIVLVGYILVCSFLHLLCRLSCKWPGYGSCANSSAWSLHVVLFRWRFFGFFPSSCHYNFWAVQLALHCCLLLYLSWGGR